MRALYFAYGSNMSTRRLLERLPAARALGAARMVDRRLAFNKPGRDGSGKANLVPAPSLPATRAWAFGVVYEVEHADLNVLDGFELGYTRSLHEVEIVTGEPVTAALYLAEPRAPELVPYDWYRDHLLTGAREHALPSELIAALEALEVLRT